MNYNFIGPVILFIIFEYFSWWNTVAFPFVLWSSVSGLLHIFFFNFIFIQASINYYKSIFTDPGQVPLNWVPENASKDDVENAKKVSYDVHNVRSVVWCSTCERCIPRRARHCRECKKCRMKMDHHCPWIDNCVGHYNHKYFILFLTYQFII